MGGKVVNKLIEVAFEDCLKFIEGEVYPVICDPVLREIVRSYSSTSVAGADL